jgi:hypothetical protein
MSEELGYGPGVDCGKDAGCIQQLAVRLDAEQVRDLSAAAARVLSSLLRPDYRGEWASH